MKNKKNGKHSGIILLIVGLSLMALGTFLKSDKTGDIEQIPYTEYLALLEEGKVDAVTYDYDSGLMNVALFDEKTKNMTVKEREEYEHDESQLRITYYPDYENFKKDLLEQDVIVRQSSDNFFVSLAKGFETYFSIFLIIALFVILGRKSPLATTEHLAVVSKDEIETGFDDVIGHDEVKADLQLLVKQLKSGVDAKDLSHGIIFEGGAGTGKTMLAKAVAKEAGVNFISVNSSELIAMYVGLGAKRVRDAFKLARKMSPCVVFFDEIDAVGRQRGDNKTSGENDQTINALLTELDGFQKKGNILVIAATNRADKLDTALLRSGRFDRKIKIEAPRDWQTRQKLFDHYLKDNRDKTVDTQTLAKMVVGFSGADIANVCREANLIAFRDDNEKITQDNLQEAIEKIVFKGNRSNKEQHQQDLKVAAYHEAGHAIVKLLRGEEISNISIIAMTSGVGGAVFGADRDVLHTTKKEIETEIMCACGGRASEEIKFGCDNITDGASNDIKQVSSLLHSYIYELGFDEETGFVFFDDNQTVLSELAAKRKITLSKEFYHQTRSLLKNNYCLVEKLAQKLFEVKTMSGDEVVQFLDINSDGKVD